MSFGLVGNDEDLSQRDSYKKIDPLILIGVALIIICGISLLRLG